MPERTIKLQFTEEERTVPKVEKAAEAAEQKSKKLEKAEKKAPRKRRLQIVGTDTGELKVQLTSSEKRPSKLRTATEKPLDAVSVQVHRQIAEDGEDNAGVEGALRLEETAEGGGRMLMNIGHSRQMKLQRTVSKAERAADKANLNALNRLAEEQNPQFHSNPISRWQQKQAIKKQYAAAKAGKTADGVVHAAEITRRASEAVSGGAGAAGSKLGSLAAKHGKVLLPAAAILLLVAVLLMGMQSCTLLFYGALSNTVGSTYLSEETDMLDAEAAYLSMEDDLLAWVWDIESLYPGYDEYEYDVDYIGHDPHDLAAYLTALLGAYTADSAQAHMEELFQKQYTCSTYRNVEPRTRLETVTVTVPDPETGEDTEQEIEMEVPYDCYILYVEVSAKSIEDTAKDLLTEEEYERFQMCRSVQGNNPDLFSGGTE